MGRPGLLRSICKKSLGQPNRSSIPEDLHNAFQHVPKTKVALRARTGIYQSYPLTEISNQTSKEVMLSFVSSIGKLSSFENVFGCKYDLDKTYLSNGL